MCISLTFRGKQPCIQRSNRIRQAARNRNVLSVRKDDEGGLTKQLGNEGLAAWRGEIEAVRPDGFGRLVYKCYYFDSS